MIFFLFFILSSLLVGSDLLSFFIVSLKVQLRSLLLQNLARNILMSVSSSIPPTVYPNGTTILLVNI